jgi:hypothetical protein
MELENREVHPAYGQLEIGRGSSSNRVPLYGTSNQCRETIRLVIHESEVVRNLSRYWYHTRDPIIEIEMSPAQWAEAITSLNCGSGTPVTIRRVMVAGKYKRIEDPPYEHARDLFETEFKEHVQDINKNCREMIEKVESMAGQKTIKKSDFNGIIVMLRQIQQNIEQNLPFIESSFNEQLDKSVSSAKIELDAFVDSRIRQTGIAALKDSVALPGPENK